MALPHVTKNALRIPDLLSPIVSILCIKKRWKRWAEQERRPLPFHFLRRAWERD